MLHVQICFFAKYSPLPITRTFKGNRKQQGRSYLYAGCARAYQKKSRVGKKNKIVIIIIRYESEPLRKKKKTKDKLDKIFNN